MPINILKHNPYIDVLQLKNDTVKDAEDFTELAMVMDYVESKQMAAAISGSHQISENLPTKEEISKLESEKMKEEDPREVLRRMALEDGIKLSDDDEDDEDDEGSEYAI